MPNQLEEQLRTIQQYRNIAMTEKTNRPEICAEISTKRMYLLLLKAQEMILEDNPKYFKKEILSLLSTVEHEILMLNDENNSICRDLFK